MNAPSASIAGDLGGLAVSKVMTPNVVALTEDLGLMAAMDVVISTGLRHVVVVDREGALRGMVTAESLAAALLPHAIAPRVAVARLMQPRTVVLAPDTTVRETARRMLDAVVDAACVVDGTQRVLGIVTWSDIVRLVAGGSTHAGGVELRFVD